MQSLLDGKAVKLIGKNLMRGRVYFTFYIVPYDTAHLEVIHRWGKKRYYISKIQETVDKLVDEGNTHISLGAHTSILSGNGLFLAEGKRAKILTGNTLTVASCLYHLERYVERRKKKDPGPITIAIAGAHGNIGSGLAGCFDGEKYKDTKIILAGTNIRKLELLRKKLFSPERSVHCTNDLFALQHADILVSCTSTNDPLIFSYHIHPDKKVFIIDIAVPGSVSEEVKKMPNVEFYREASTVYLPDDPAFLISTHTPAGKIFCCAAEAILAALYEVREPLKGHIQPACIRRMMELGVKEDLFNKKVYAPPV
jgi:predicted amino acid dehydrogenase